MIAPMSTNLTSVLTDAASVAIKPEVASTSLPAPSLPEKGTQAPSQNSTTQDTVALSNAAVDMSKALNEQADKRSELKKEAARKEEQSPEKASKAYLAAGKSYPPFMGNGEELKALKESSPALYREILRMIIPAPLNLSPTELQALQGPAVSSSKTGTTTA